MRCKKLKGRDLTMMTIEDQKLIDRLKNACSKLDADYKIGLVTEADYQAKCKLVEAAMVKIESISGTHT